MREKARERHSHTQHPRLHQNPIRIQHPSPLPPPPHILSYPNQYHQQTHITPHPPPLPPPPSYPLTHFSYPHPPPLIRDVPPPSQTFPKLRSWKHQIELEKSRKQNEPWEANFRSGKDVQSKRGEISDSFGRNNLVTVYVDNLRPEVEYHIFRRTFETVGTMRDVYVPRRMRKNRTTKYGFVRFDSLQEAKAVVEMCNGKKCLGQPMEVKLAAFGYQKRGRKAESIEKASNRRERNIITRPAITDSRSYCEVAKGEAKQSKLIDLSYDMDPDNEEWLVASAVVHIRNTEQTIPLHERFFEADIPVECIAPMGGGLFLLSFTSREEMLDILDKEKDFLNTWFNLAKPWSHDLLRKDRVVWVQCWGIPLQAWSQNLFKAIGDLWGNLISVDEETLRRKESC